MLRLTFGVLLAGWLGSYVCADEPAKKQEGEKIPAPKVKLEPLNPMGVMPYVPPPRSDSLEVWQHYGVNAMGRFVPRVIVLPSGAYYSRNLQPYPWVSNRTTAILPRE